MTEPVDPVRIALQSALGALAPGPDVVVAASGYGVDLVCFDDLTINLDETDTESVESLAQDNYHRLITPEGSLPDDLDYGKDLTSYMSRGTSTLALMGIEGEIETELLKDERNAVVSAAVVVTSLLPCVLTISIDVTPANPDLVPFKMIIAVDKSGTFLEDIT